MKRFMIAILMTAFIGTIAFAGPSSTEGESSTECLMMQETDERINPKHNLSSVKTLVTKPKTGTTAQ